MDKVTIGSISMTWDVGSRLAFIRFEHETQATGRDGKPFGLLGDGGKLGSVDAEYRSVWGKFFPQYREDSYIAFFNMNPIIRIAAEMFGLGMGLRLKAFVHEQEPRSWLPEKGIPA